MKPDAAIAKILLDAGAVTLRPDEPFRYPSGLASPLYIDHRVLLSNPAARKQISAALAKLITTNHPRLGLIAATATSGIPWASWLAAALNLPMVYVRDRPKKHGLQNQIEGALPPGASVVVVRDLIFTGSSTLKTVKAIRKAGGVPLAVIAIFNYQLQQCADTFEKAGIPLHTLTNFQALVEQADRQGLLTKDYRDQVLAWASDPVRWSAIMQKSKSK